MGLRAELSVEGLDIRHDRVDKTGSVTLRHNSRLHHIGIGRAHKHTAVTLLVADLDIRVIATQTGELLRHLTLNPTRDYQPQTNPEKPQPVGSQGSDVSRHHSAGS